MSKFLVPIQVHLKYTFSARSRLIFEAKTIRHFWNILPPFSYGNRMSLWAVSTNLMIGPKPSHLLTKPRGLLLSC